MVFEQVQVRCQQRQKQKQIKDYLYRVQYGVIRRLVVRVYGQEKGVCRDTLLGTCGLSKSSRLNVRAVRPVCNGLVRLINEGFRIPSRLRNVFCCGGGGELPPSEDVVPFVFTVGTSNSPRTLDIRPDAFTVTVLYIIYPSLSIRQISGGS